MASPVNQQQIRGKNKDGQNTSPPTATAKKNYTAQTIGKNENGSVWIGAIHKQGDVTSAVALRNEQDGAHQLCLDIDGQRRSTTTSTSPGKFQVDCGKYPWLSEEFPDLDAEKIKDMKESMDSCLIHAHNGNIIIKASNGKIRMEATDIELVTKGVGETKGNISINASENVILECKKLQTTTSVLTKMCSAGDFEQAANGVLSTYASLLSSITDAVFGKPSKFGGQLERQKNNLPTASQETVASLDRGDKAFQYKSGTNQLDYD